MEEFEDYSKTTILLSDESWAHIQSGHPEITLPMIKNTLQYPIEVRESNLSSSSLLYYSAKIKTETKIRYICVVVKTTLIGDRYIQTAMTASYLKEGKIVYRQEE